MKISLTKNIISIIQYGIVAVTTVIILIILMQLWNAELNIPFKYEGDSLQVAEYIKCIIDNGWVLDNPFVGAPYGKNLRDYGMSDSLHLFIMKIIGLLTGDFAATMNIYFLLTFPLTALISFYVFKTFGIKPLLAGVGAMLYAFMPYHFYRGINHLFLAAYYLIPLNVMMILWVIRGDCDEFIDRSTYLGFNRKWIGGFVVGLVSSCAGIYYAFFSCMFLCAAGIIRMIEKQRIVPFLAALTFTSSIIIGGLVNHIPTLVYHLREGKNPVAMARVYHEVELYALKITHLLLPIQGHRIGFLAKKRAQYDQESSYIYRFPQESGSESLGLITSIGFLIIVIVIFFPRSTLNSLELIRYLSLLTIFALIISVTGGFNSFIAPFVGFKIRAYNRVSIFLAFFSIFGLLCIIQFLFDKIHQSEKLKSNIINRWKLIDSCLVILSLFIVIFGICDQTPKTIVPDYNAIKTKYQLDRSFISLIENTIPRYSMVFQLPYMAYPEVEPVNGLKNYEHFRAYLHSKTLRWSYGAVKGRFGDEWQKNVGLQPVPTMVTELRQSGFKGILINRTGYIDNGEQIVSELSSFLQEKALLNGDGSLLFFKL